MYKLSEVDWKKIALVDLLSEENKIFSELTKKTIKKYIKLWKKILFITNRKWYTSSFLCQDCWHIPKCEYCDVPISKYVIKKENSHQFVYMCSICHRIYPQKLKCEKCWGYNIKEIWIWTYKLKELVKLEFWIDSLVVENTDVNSINKIKLLENELKNKNYVISTNILSFPSQVFVPDIIIFPNADTWLWIPDFNVCEKHFMQLYEIVKNYPTKNFIIQTFNFEHYVYQNLLKLDINGFWKKELSFRKMLNYPPFSELSVLMYKNQIEEKVYLKISKLESELRYLAEKNEEDIEIYPTPQLVFKKFWKYHYNIILKWKNLKSFLDKAVVLLKIKKKWFQIDWLPNNLI